MPDPLPHLAWLRTFEASARHLSFAVAARELNLTPAAVSQQVRALEQRLGVRLFERQARGLKLTDVGRAYLVPVRKALDELAVATTGLFGTRHAGRLVVQVSASFGALVLAPRLGRFRALYPDIDVCLYSSVWGDGPDDGSFDLVVRYGAGGWEGFEAERIAEPVSVPVLPAALPFGSDPARTVIDCARQNAIHILSCDDLWGRMLRALGETEPTFARAITVDTSVNALQLVAAGVGCAMIAPELAAHHVAQGLVQVPPDIILRHESAHHLLVPRRKRPKSVEAGLFRDWLLSEMTPATAP